MSSFHSTFWFPFPMSFSPPLCAHWISALWPVLTSPKLITKWLNTLLWTSICVCMCKDYSYMYKYTSAYFLILFLLLLLPPSPPFYASRFALSVPADDVSCDGLLLALLPISTGHSQIYSAFLQRPVPMLHFGSAVKNYLKCWWFQTHKKER